MKALIFSILAAAVMAAPAAKAETPALPTLDKAHTALLITDPQNDFLSEKGGLFPLMKDNLAETKAIANIETLMKTAKAENIKLAVDPLVYTVADDAWVNPGALQKQLLGLKVLHRAALNDPKGFEGSGADFYEPYKSYIYDGKSIVVAPHKMYGPESNDLIYQLRSHGIDTVVLGGMVANLCVDSHMRALMENGFRVYVVKDAVAAPGKEAYQAALVNYGMIANGVLTTAEAVQAMSK